jgi:hypothetical protein
MALLRLYRTGTRHFLGSTDPRLRPNRDHKTPPLEQNGQFCSKPGREPALGTDN